MQCVGVCVGVGACTIAIPAEAAVPKSKSKLVVVRIVVRRPFVYVLHGSGKTIRGIVIAFLAEQHRSQVVLGNVTTVHTACVVVALLLFLVAMIVVVVIGIIVSRLVLLLLIFILLLLMLMLMLIFLLWLSLLPLPSSGTRTKPSELFFHRYQSRRRRI